jgi:hypothetical protein
MLGRLAWIGGLLVVSATLSCGDDGPPVCPTGDCTLPGSTVVKWKFNHFPLLNFESDACSELNVATVRVEANLADGTPVDMMEKTCGEGQLTFLGLAQGAYKFVVTPIDIDGNSLVTAPVTAMGNAAGPGATSDIPVDVNYPAWSRPYTGQLLFRLKWGGATCSAAVPTPVAKQQITLTAGGTVRTESTSIDNVVFQKLDGTDVKPCQEFTAAFPQNVMGIPFGPATLLVVGKDAADVVLFQHTFDTFIGAGVFNPTLTYDNPVDAGIDGP